MQKFDIKRGDTSPAIRFSLIPSDLNLFGAGVKFQMRNPRLGTTIDAPAEIISATPPVVQYNWQAGDTAEVGQYQAEFRVEYADGAIETFPNRGFIIVNVNKDVPDL
jgi:hypothetical protein